MFWAGPNFLWQTKIFIYILWQSQTFCARQKDDWHSVKLFFVLAQKFLRGTKCGQIFGLAQKILGPVKEQGINCYLPPQKYGDLEILKDLVSKLMLLKHNPNN